MTNFDFGLVSSLEKVLPHLHPSLKNSLTLRGFSGETQSVQIAYTCRNDDFGESDCQFYMAVQSEIQNMSASVKWDLFHVHTHVTAPGMMTTW